MRGVLVDDCRLLVLEHPPAVSPRDLFLLRRLTSLSSTSIAHALQARLPGMHVQTWRRGPPRCPMGPYFATLIGMQDALTALLARYAALVDAQMQHVLAAFTEPRGFYGMMRYHLGWVDERLQPVAAAHGKGLRAALLLLVNNAFGGDEATALPLAAAIELLHNFSLVHDDVEDGGALRRHRPTLWSLWGAPLSIN